MIHSLVLFFSTILSVNGVRRLPNEQNTNTHSRRLFYDEPNHGDIPLPEHHTYRFAAEGDNDNPDPNSHLVTSLPLLPDGVFPTKHWAGHIQASPDASDKKIFYWLFEPGNDGSNNDPSNIPLVIWLNGGPGCSSMDGLWLENGPLRLNPGKNGWTIDVNPYSWHNAAAWTLYVDQPVG